jgi:cobalamin biosynthesis protein CbiG
MFHQVEHVSEGGDTEGGATVTPVGVGYNKRHKAVRVANELIRCLKRQGVQVNAEGV